jgi:hypothetical protein
MSTTSFLFIGKKSHIFSTDRVDACHSLRYGLGNYSGYLASPQDIEKI